MKLKLCKTCGETKPLDQFYLRGDKRGNYYRMGPCRSCNTIKKQEWAKKNRPWLNDYRREQIKRWTVAHPERAIASRKERFARIRRRVVDGYGGECACCGETNIHFLTIDHIFNDGHIERKTPEGKKLTGIGFYKRLHRLGFPKDRYQLFCFNCNCGKGRRGECPHKLPSPRIYEIPHWIGAA